MPVLTHLAELVSWYCTRAKAILASPPQLCSQNASPSTKNPQTNKKPNLNQTKDTKNPKPTNKVTNKTQQKTPNNPHSSKKNSKLKQNTPRQLGDLFLLLQESKSSSERIMTCMKIHLIPGFEQRIWFQIMTGICKSHLLYGFFKCLFKKGLMLTCSFPEESLHSCL